MSDEIVLIHGQTGQQERRPLQTEENPETGLRQAGVAPHMGQTLTPHIVTFSGAIGGASRSYLPSDEALQHSWANAQHMRQDAAIMEPLEVRRRAVALLDWHIEPDDPEDPQQQEMAETVSWILRQIPRFYQYRETLLDAIFYGRYAVINRNYCLVCPWAAHPSPSWKMRILNRSNPTALRLVGLSIPAQ